ncbi:MAG: ATP-binding protein [Nitrospirales bacterium]
MGRAEDLFNRIVQAGEKAIDEFILDRQSEELFLAFKRSADDGKGRKLHDTDRKNLSKAISGFGNSEGGVIVWGVDCRDDAAHGDVASAKVPIENPKRFLSRLEGSITGCTIPAHPHVRHQAVELNGLGFVATYIPKSFLAPHQTVGQYQYFMRAGSDFVPVPHAVLSGLFGRHPQPFVFHTWLISPPKIQGEAVHISIGFLLGNQGPSIARELYVNARVFQPKWASEGRYQCMDQQNWTGHVTLGHMLNLIANDSYRLAPNAMALPFNIELFFQPPFESKLSYEITFGHQNSPMRKLSAEVEPAKISEAYILFMAGQGEPNEATKDLFLDKVFPFGKENKNMSQEQYDVWLAGGN